MTKNEALKMAIEYLECPAQGGQKLTVINACKEALEQPEGKEFFERGKEIARWADKQALEQPTIAELNNEYLRDTNVIGLEQPAQEPYGYIAQDASGLDKPIFNNSEKQLLQTVDDLNHWDDFIVKPLYTHPHQWQGLTDDERIKCYEASGHKQHIRPQDKFAVLELSIAIEQALKEKNYG